MGGVTDNVTAEVGGLGSGGSDGQCEVKEVKMCSC